MSPCKDCPDRYTACHDHCDKYKAWKAEKDAVKKDMLLRKSIDDTARKCRSKWNPGKKDTTGKYINSFR